MEEMPEVKRCPICGAQIGSSDGLCPPCVMKLAARHDAPPQPAGSPGLDRLLAQTLPPLGVKFHYFGDYELLEEIARGGMGVVFRARQISLNRIVAVKLIREGRLATPEAVRRFHVEAEAAAALDHPNIVPIHEIAEHEGHHYFSMKLVEGSNLAQRLAASTKPVPLREAAALVAKIARAVHYAHQRGILHRDIKPANILIDQHGEPHITDFGLAKVLQVDEGQTASGTLLGTPAYMSPEQAAGNNGQLTTASDLYTLGVVLYEMLAGQTPFRAPTPVETLKLVVEAEPKPLRSVRREVDRDLQTICLKCLNKNPVQRYSSAGELADELERWLLGESIKARPTHQIEKVWRWCRKRPAIAALSTLATILAVLSALGWMVARTRAITEAREKRKALEILNASDLFLVDRALNETNLEHSSDILAGLQDVINRNPTNPWFWRARAVVMNKINRLPESYSDYSKAIELAESDRKNRQLWKESLLNRATLLRRMNRDVDAGMDYRRAVWLPHGTSSIPPDFRDASQVSVILGKTNRESGLFFIYEVDSLHSHAFKSGKECRLFKPRGGRGWDYAYFGIEPTFKWRCSTNITITVEYAGCDEGEFGIHYDGGRGPYGKSDQVVQFRKSEEWNVAEFHLNDVNFDSRQNGAADFRIWTHSCGLYVHAVTVFRVKSNVHQLELSDTALERTFGAHESSFARDFLTTPNQANGVADRWQFFDGIDVTNRNGVYNRLPFYAASIQASGTEGWREKFDRPPYIGKHTRADALFPFIRIGEGHLHPGNDGRGAAIGFLTPSNGFYEVSASLKAAGGGSINWYLDRGPGSNVLATGRHLRGGRNQNIYAPHLQLAAGEVVFLTVDNDGDWFADSTTVEFVVRPARVWLNLGAYHPPVTNFGHSYRIDYIDAFQPSNTWRFLTNVTLTETSQVVLDLTPPLAARRYYRAVR